MRIAFQDFLPDRAELDTQHGPVATNAFPVGPGDYRPIPGPVAFSDALDSAPRGLWLAKTNAGDFQAFAATNTTLEKLVGTAWTEIGNSFSPPSDENWAGVQFGTEFFFTNGSDGLYKFDIEAGSSVSAVSSSPVAKHMDVVEEYLCTGNDGDSPRKFRWSDTNAGSTWGSGNAGSQTFPDGGAISAICGASHLVIQESIIRRIIPDPGGDIFLFEKLEQAKGSIAPESVIRFGETVAYLAEDGFWWAGEPIGQNAVNQFFLSQINQNNIYTVMGRLDPNRPLFWWHYRTGDNTTYDKALIFNWRTRQWASAEVSIAFAAESATTGYTLETLSAEYPDLETVPYPLDSRVWLGGRPVYAVIDTDNKLAFLEGDNLEATLEIGERAFIPGARARIGGVRPLVDSTGAVIRVRTRQRPGGTATWGSEVSQQNSGLCPVNRGGRFHRFRVRIPAAEAWTHAQGIEIPDSTIAHDGMR